MIFGGRRIKLRPFTSLDRAFQVVVNHALAVEAMVELGHAYQVWQRRSIGLLLGDEQSTESRFRGGWRPSPARYGV